MQLIINQHVKNELHLVEVNPVDEDFSNRKDIWKDDPMRLLCTQVPDKSVLVAEGVINENHTEENYKRIEQINLCQSYDRIIFCVWMGNADKLLETCTKYEIKIPFYIVTSCIRYYKSKNPKIIFFPEEELHAIHYPIIPQINPTKKFSCLNSNKWSHRILTYIHLYSKPYFDEIIFSWGRQTGYSLDFLDQEDFINDIVITDEEKIKLASMPQRILAHPEDDKEYNDRTTNHIAYTDACLNIVTETRSRNINARLTEKTFKPIVAGQFFIIIGSKGIVDYVRLLGFDVFDDIIDHSYDTIVDDRLRIKTVIEEIDRLNELNLIQLHQQSKNRFVKNQRHLKSKELINQFPPMEFPV